MSQAVADEKHVVPRGVAVLELGGGKSKLQKEIPMSVQDLFSKNNKTLLPVYDAMISAIVSERKTTRMFGKWRDQELEHVIDLFRPEFEAQHVKVALCKRSSRRHKYRWLEFIHIDVAKGYVSQYDVSNMSNQIIYTVFTKLRFPNGVAVLELKQKLGRKDKLRNKIPGQVEKMMRKKNLMAEYDSLVESCIVDGVGRTFQRWNIDKLKRVIAEYRPIFAEKGVDLYICHKQEDVQHAEGGHTEFFRWVEFVDVELQPNYSPQRDAYTKKEGPPTCAIM